MNLEKLGNYMETATASEIEEEVFKLSESGGLRRLNSILYGAKYQVRSERFINNVIAMSSDDQTKFFGTPISSFAKAALDILGVKKYTGDDRYIHEMIESGFVDI